MCLARLAGYLLISVHFDRMLQTSRKSSIITEYYELIYFICALLISRTAVSQPLRSHTEVARTADLRIGSVASHGDAWEPSYEPKKVGRILTRYFGSFGGPKNYSIRLAKISAGESRDRTQPILKRPSGAID